MNLAYTQETGQVAASPSSPAKQGMFTPILTMVGFFLIFYLLLVRPTQKREKERKRKIDSLQEGDKVITNGGISGKVVKIKDSSIILESKDTQIEIMKFAIAHVDKN